MKVMKPHKKWINNYIPIITLLIFLISVVSASHDLVSDGINDLGSSYIRLPSFKSLLSSESCEPSYGFLPCTTTVLGNAFLIVVYGYLMYTAATFLSNGSELLLEILGPGIIGGLFLPILGALPDAMLILVSGLSGTPETAQDQVSVGMGLLAGSTVMLLTVIWGTCVLIGKCDLENSIAIDETNTKGFDLTGSGVSVDIWTSYAARIMALSVLPFLVVQLPQALNSSSGRHLAVLIALILSLAMLISYCVFQPWIQKRRLYYVKHKRVMTGFLKHLKKKALGRLCDHEGNPNREIITKIFHALDHDESGYLSRGELGAFVVGMNFEGMSMGKDDIVEKVMKEFDTGNQDGKLDLEEFIQGISNEEAGEEIENIKATTIKAILFLVLGTIIAGVFADPLVDAVDNFSDATSIPSFFISFIALPLATNSSEAVSALIFASRKNRRSASLTFSELYGAVTMNNVLCLSVFLALVYGRGLVWDFSSEVLVILLVCVIIGGIGSFRTAFPIWTSFVAFLLYPASLALVYVLDYVFGWS
ncbi:Sodium/calcium exchanger NCL [Bienertia sinuspersici]